MARDIGPAARAIIKSYELGPRGENPPLYAYLCPAGVPTIGWGHTKGVKLGDTCTIQQAERWFIDDMDEAEGYTEAALAGGYIDDRGRLVRGAGVPSPANDHEFGALVSCMFNCGPQFMKSTAIRLHRAGDKAGAARALLDWNKGRVNGKLAVLPGLVRRRAEESALYLRPMMSEAPKPMPQAVEPPQARSKTGEAIAAGTVAAGTVAAGGSDIVDAAREVLPQAQSAAWAAGAIKYVLIALALLPLGYALWRIIKAKREGRHTST